MAAGDSYHISGNLLPAKDAIKFLGGAVDDGVQIDALAAAAVTANHTSGTISAWIMVPDVTGTYAIVGAGDASAVEYFYFAVVAGKLQVKAATVGPDVAWDLITTSIVLTPYKWHHVAFVQDAVKPRMYLDGVYISAVTETDVTEAGYWFDDMALLDGMHIGAADSIAGDAALTLEFKGLISTVTIWSGTTTDGALTAAQIEQDYNGESVGTPYGQYTWTDATLYTNAANAGTYDGTKVGDIILVHGASEFTARLQYEPAAAIVVADVVTNIAITNGVGHALVVKAA